MSCLHNIKVAARASALSRAQVIEVQRELSLYHPEYILESTFVQTTGDKDQKTSLRTLERSDFFTKEVDELVLQHTCRIAIHSAKDLPETPVPGLCTIWITKGLDPADVLVLRPEMSLQNLPAGAIMATSSERRELAVNALRPDLKFMDLRGTIEQRLSLLDTGQADGIVVAEAALIRLGLTHLNRVRLPGSAVNGQGQLAIVALEDDNEMKELFSCLATP